MEEQSKTTHQKAFQINRDSLRYGAFAEIGAGQEVARWFFHVGGAAGTVAKTVSAYDMSVSDTLYGPADRYVSQKRLEAMLDHEFDSLVGILGPKRTDTSAFFVFADTLATRSFSHREDGQGWMGIRFQHETHSDISEIVIHVRMLDRENDREQESIGLIGVNLIYAAFYHHSEPAVIVSQLLDGLGPGRVEVDLIRFSGKCFEAIDNRLMSLQLVEQGLTDAAMFTAQREVLQPSDFLYKKAVLVERGSFRPVTKAAFAMLESARNQFGAAAQAVGLDPVVVMEMSLADLRGGGDVDHADFLSRSEVLGALNQTVMISSFGPHHLVAAYLRRFTSQPLAFVMGVPGVLEMFQEKYYSGLPGGILEALGGLFNGDVTLYVCPTLDAESGQLLTLHDLRIPERTHSLLTHLVRNHRMVGLDQYAPELLGVLPGEVLAMIQRGDEAWEAQVPAAAADAIKRRRLFGLGSQSSAR